MTDYNIKLDKPLETNSEVTFTVYASKWYRLRLQLAIVLLKLVSWLMNSNIEFIFVEEDA
jgi:hypothetical protein